VTTHKYALNASITAGKYIISGFWCVVGGILCFTYGRKISNQLKRNKGEGESAQFKRIKRLLVSE